MLVFVAWVRAIVVLDSRCVKLSWISVVLYLMPLRIGVRIVSDVGSQILGWFLENLVAGFGDQVIVFVSEVIRVN